MPNIDKLKKKSRKLSTGINSDIKRSEKITKTIKKQEATLKNINKDVAVASKKKEDVEKSLIILVKKHESVKVSLEGYNKDVNEVLSVIEERTSALGMLKGKYESSEAKLKKCLEQLRQKCDKARKELLEEISSLENRCDELNRTNVVLAENGDKIVRQNSATDGAVKTLKEEAVRLNAEIQDKEKESEKLAIGIVKLNEEKEEVIIEKGNAEKEEAKIIKNIVKLKEDEESANKDYESATARMIKLGEREDAYKENKIELIRLYKKGGLKDPFQN